MLTFFGVVSAVSGGNPAANRMAAVALNHKTRRKDNDLLRMADADPTGLMKTIMPKDYNERTKIQLQLAQSGLTSAHAVRNFYLIRALLGFVLPTIFIAVILASKSTVISLPDFMLHSVANLNQLRIFQILSVLLAVGFFGPIMWLNGRVKARKRKIEEGFPNALDLIQISTESGLGFDASMTRVGNELALVSPEISYEFLTAQREIQAGRSRDKALTDIATRTGVEEITSFTNVVLQSIQFGTPISAALTAYAEEMRKYRELRAQEQANKLPVKMSAVMASLMLPALLMITIGPVVIRYIRFFSG
ncbi:MAG: type II secretion system F family protein [Amylibacter sp.]